MMVGFMENTKWTMGKLFLKSFLSKVSDMMKKNGFLLLKSIGIQIQLMAFKEKFIILNLVIITSHNTLQILKYKNLTKMEI